MLACGRHDDSGECPAQPDILQRLDTRFSEANAQFARRGTIYKSGYARIFGFGV